MKQKNNKYEEGHRRHRHGHPLLWLIIVEVLAILIGLLVVLVTTMQEDMKKQESVEALVQEATEEVETEAVEEETEFTGDGLVPIPDISEQILPLNQWSRPGKKLKSLQYIVIHYLGNPETTAQQNHDYFESLAELHETSMSANYVVGMEGEIIHCVPDDEVAYASNEANSYSISIENCHPDETGKLTVDTYDSLVKLVAYLCQTYDIDADHIIRHYDVTGKDCPKYFVEHTDAWNQFKLDVVSYRAKCEGINEIPEFETETEPEDLAEIIADNAE